MPFSGDRQADQLGSEPTGDPADLRTEQADARQPRGAGRLVGLVQLLARQAAQEHWRSVQRMRELCEPQEESQRSRPPGKPMEPGL